MKVLLISGDADHRRSLADVLRERGDHVTLRSSARRAFAGRTFDCVVIDLGLGADALALVRQARARDDQAAVVVLGHDDDERMEGALRAGADDFLAAPVDPAAIRARLQVIERVNASRRERLALEQNLETSRSRSRTLIESVYDGLVLLDAQGVILFANSRFSELTGFAGIELIGEHADDVLRTPQGQALLAIEPERAKASVRSAVTELATKDGDACKVELTVSPIADEENRSGSVAVLRLLGDDATAQTQAALDRERAFFRQLFQNAPSGIVILDNDDRVVEANEPFYRMFRLRPEAVVGQPLSDLIVPEDLRAEADDLSQSVFDLRTIERETVRLRSDGTPIDVAILGYPIVLDDQQLGAYGMYTDITARKKAERRLFHEAFHDPLTGLPNRNLLRDRLQRALAQAERGDNAFALMFVDLDGFKAINDQHGHGVGDQLLIEIAGRLEGCLRPGDTTARFGGDEFMILLENLAQTGGVEPIATRVLEAVRAPVEIGDLSLITAASIGIAVSSLGLTSEEQMLRAADRAMYRAKAAGKDRFEVAPPPQAPSGRTAFGEDLKGGLDDDALKLAFIPVAVVERSRLVGLSVQATWHHAEHGVIAAPALRAIAEQTGMVAELSQWLLDRVGATLAGWRDRHPEHDGPLIYLDLPTPALYRTGFVDQLISTLAGHDVAHATFVLTLPWHALEESATFVEALWAVRATGVRLAVDGCGFGGVPIRLLQRLPIDILRLDARLARDPQPGGTDAETLRALRSLADALSMQVVAVGVDSADQVEGVARAGIRTMQGRGVGRELDADEIEHWIDGGEIGVPGQPDPDADAAVEEHETQSMARPTEIELEAPEAS